jgi:radical SAM protein with 4Fe4S-binding SPASM domain
VISLLDQFLEGGTSIQIRRPDHTEERNRLFLQVWGEEGYWHVVDGEFRALLEEFEKPASLNAVLKRRPEWKQHKRAIQSQLRRMKKAGMAGGRLAPVSPPKIENITINLTTACNLKCRSCYVPLESRTPTRIDTSRLLAFLKDIRPGLSRQATISLLGGEPMLHPEGLLAVGRWAKENKLTCNVSTNGTPPRDDLLRALAETRIKVQVSIDGATATTNDAIRGTATFAKATATARRLAAGGIATTLCMVCCRDNVGEIPAYFNLAHSLGAEEVRFIPLKKLGSGGAGELVPAPQLEIVKAVCAELDAHSEYRRMCRSDVYSIICYMLKETSRRRSCGSGTQTLLVQSDGTVYPCINTTIPKLKLGHVGDGKASLLSQGMKFGETLAIDSPHHPCHRCYVRRWCLAGCPGETLQQNGALTRQHWACNDLRQTISFVMWRLANEREPHAQTLSRTCV